MPTTSLNYEALPQMKYNDFKKAVKEKSQWRKATAIVLLFDYKMGSKKMPVILPLRRANQLKPLLKQIRADKHPNQKLAAGLLSIQKGETGQEIVFKMTHGGYQLEAVETKVAPLFQALLKLGFKAEQGSETDLENIPNENQTDVGADGSLPNTNPKGNNDLKDNPQVAPDTDPTTQRKATTSVLNQLKKTYQKEVMPIVQRFKEKANTLLDADTLRDALEQVDQFMEQYQNSDPELQKKLAPAHKKYQKEQQQLQKIAAKLDHIDIAPTSPEEVDTALANLQKRLDLLSA